MFCITHTFFITHIFVYLLCYSQHDKHSGELDKLRTALGTCEQRDVKARQVSYCRSSGVLDTVYAMQDLKNAKTGLKKTVKALEKEKEKMEELRAAPERLQKEIANAEKKLKILEVSDIIHYVLT